jgi:very-long-chain ceramide synthase
MLSFLRPCLAPFFSLSYPTDTPANVDSFPNFPYYTTGPLDACLVITCIAVMAVLRDIVRLAILEPFARWHLSRDLRRKIGQQSPKVRNGNGNPHYHPHANGDARPISKREAHLMHRSVLRFAEQGWSALYYSLQWTFGFVCHHSLSLSLFMSPHTEIAIVYPP